jgi:hypothetical protein
VRQHPEDPRLTEPIRYRQLAFVLEKGDQDIDDARTLSVFGHPTGGRPRPDPDAGSPKDTQFLAIGSSLGIFKYRDQTYFDTFFDGGGWPDFAGERADLPSLMNHLAVFAHHDGVTRQVCEYLYRGKQAKQAARHGHSNE